MGKAAGDGDPDVLDDRAAFAGDDADDTGQAGQRAFAVGVEQPLGREALADHLDSRQQRADAGIFHPLDDQLVG